MNVKIDVDLPTDRAVQLASLLSFLRNESTYPHAYEVIQTAIRFLMVYPTTAGPFEVKKKKVD